MIYFPKGEPQELSSSIVLLLPWYLEESFVRLFSSMSLCVIQSYCPEEVEREVEQFHIDLALEWQHGPDDYPIRDLLRRCKKSVPILLLLNWNGGIPSNFSSLGYQDYLNVPWKVDELISKFYEALPESKKSILRDLLKRYEKKQG